MRMARHGSAYTSATSSTCLRWLRCGSRGAVSGLANFMPRVVHRLAHGARRRPRTASDHARVARLLGGLAAMR